MPQFRERCPETPSKETANRSWNNSARQAEEKCEARVWSRAADGVAGVILRLDSVLAWRHIRIICRARTKLRGTDATVLREPPL
ncbi:hypothetical protein J6590_021012 [Homalodisca vitripennis]|nr:hypothetical protein J6590_021012 [Homalodisca vitripennis]